MEIRTYNKAQLKELIESQTFAEMSVLPISSHRALSHIHNPRADADDTLMIIAWEDGVMVGYLGVLADKIYNTSGQGYKCGWLSCMWVNPDLRGKGIAKQLLAIAFKKWNDHILVTEFTPEAKGLYDRSAGFNDLRVSSGLRCYLRFNLHEVLPKKNEKYKSWLIVLKSIDAIANVPNAIRLAFFRPELSGLISFQQVKEISSEVNAYIISKQNRSLERRNADDLNWLLHYPWLIQSAPTAESVRYHFSSVVENFANHCVVIKKSNEIVGYLHFTIRDGHLKLPYCYFDPECLNDIVQYIYKLMCGYRLNMFTVFHSELVSHFEQMRVPFLYKRKIKRHYIISKVLDTNFVDKDLLFIQDGDADCVFT